MNNIINILFIVFLLTSIYVNYTTHRRNKEDARLLSEMRKATEKITDQNRTETILSIDSEEIATLIIKSINDKQNKVTHLNI